MVEVAFDGERWHPAQDARVALVSPQYLLGAGTFATLRVIDGRPTWWPAHYARLVAGCAALGIEPPPEATLRAHMAESPRARLGAPYTIRINLCASTNGAARGSPAPLASTQPTLVTMLTRPLMQGTMHIELSGQQATPRACESKYFKTPNYLAAVLAKRAYPHADELLHHTHDGLISSGTVSNIFLAFEKTLVTPQLSSDCRDGVARTNILALARAAGVPCVERDVAPQELANCTHIFLSNAAWGIRFARSFGTSVKYAEPSPWLLDLQALLERDMASSAAALC
jgi:4-amino-4-deoxychorismate lyase